MLEHEIFLKLGTSRLWIQADTWHKISDFQTSIKVCGNVAVLGQAPHPDSAGVASWHRLGIGVADLST